MTDDDTVMSIEDYFHHGRRYTQLLGPCCAALRLLAIIMPHHGHAHQRHGLCQQMSLGRQHAAALVLEVQQRLRASDLEFSRQLARCASYAAA